MFSTNVILLEKIRENCDLAWKEFTDYYKPLIVLRGKDRGLKETEIQDLTQEVLFEMYKVKDKFLYDSDKGKFRNFLRTVIDRKAFKIIRKKCRESDDISILNKNSQLTSNDFEKLETNWEMNWQKFTLKRALNHVRDEVSELTFKAFEMCSIKHMDYNKVAEELNIKVDAVYLAKHRVIKRIRSIINHMENE